MSEILSSVGDVLRKVLSEFELILFAYCIRIVDRSSDHFAMLVCKIRNKFDCHCVFVEVLLFSMLLVYT